MRAPSSPSRWTSHIDDGTSCCCQIPLEQHQGTSVGVGEAPRYHASTTLHGWLDDDLEYVLDLSRNEYVIDHFDIIGMNTGAPVEVIIIL